MRYPISQILAYLRREASFQKIVYGKKINDGSMSMADAKRYQEIVLQLIEQHEFMSGEKLFAPDDTFTFSKWLKSQMFRRGDDRELHGRKATYFFNVFAEVLVYQVLDGTFRFDIIPIRMDTCTITGNYIPRSEAEAQFYFRSVLTFQPA